MTLVLSTREREVAWLAAEMSTNEIADRLGISPRTVKYHLDHARIKLGGVPTKRQLPAALRAAHVENPHNGS